MAGDPFADPFAPPRRPNPYAGFRPLTVTEQVMLARAPKRPSGAGARLPGTAVTVRALPIPNTLGVYDHEFVTLDDGDGGYIARGQPNSHGLLDFARRGLDGQLFVQARVDPERQSPDFQKGSRVLFRGDLPGMTAMQARVIAEDQAIKANAARRRYGLKRNSNSLAADVTEALFGLRVGDDRTVGYGNPLTATRSR